MRISRRNLVTGAGAGALAWVCGPARAETYPARPVKLISPFAPGGGTDIIGRIVARKFSETLGGPMIVENRAGAGGNVGAQAVARSDADGYTLLMAVNSYAINVHVYRRVPFDLKKDFAPIGLVATSPFVLVVHPSLPVKTVAELVAYAKSKPGELNFGSAGLATAPHMAIELFKLSAGIDMRHVAYQGSGPNVTGQIRNDVQVSALALNSIEGFLQSGELRVLGVMSPQRQPRLPEVPTVAETLPGFEVDLWYAMLAPRATPPDIVAKLSADLQRVIESEEMRKSLPAVGFTPAYSTPAELAALIDRDLSRWKDVTDRIGLKID